MAGHFRLAKARIWTAQAVSSTTTYNSNPVHALNLDNVGVQVNVTGTPNGTFTLQTSVDYEQDVFGNIIVAGHWIDLPVTATVSGSATQIFINVNQLPTPWVRVKYVNSSGAGVLDGFCCGKGLI